MSEWIRNLLGLVALSAYIVLIATKWIELKNLKKSTEEDNNRNIRSVEKLLWWRRYDLIRLFADYALLTAFLQSPLNDLWFSLFPETSLGFCTGTLIIINITLVISVFGDWMPIRHFIHEPGKKAPPFAEYFLQQFVRIMKIDFAMFLVWCVFLILEPTKTGLIIKIVVSVLILLCLRLLLRFASSPRKKTTETDKPVGTETRTD